MEINIRLEKEKDYRRVEEITRAAFGYPDRVKRGQIGCPYEHWMVHELRHRDGIMALSLVAELVLLDSLLLGLPGRMIKRYDLGMLLSIRRKGVRAMESKCLILE